MDWNVFRYAPNGYWLKNDPFQADINHPEGENESDQQEWVDDILWARLYRIHQTGNVQAIIQQAREHLANPPWYYHTELYAAYLLGKHGDQSDLPALMSLFLHGEAAIRKRVVLDAMELIQERIK